MSYAAGNIEKLFEIANTNCINNNVNLNFNVQALQCIAGKDPHVIQYSELQDISDEDALICIYLRTLNRFPDPAAWRTYAMYRKLCKGNQELLKHFLLQFVSRSAEFKRLNKKMVMSDQKSINFFRTVKSNGAYAIYIYAFDMKVKSYSIFHRFIFEPIWKRLPDGLKNTIRKLSGRAVK